VSRVVVVGAGVGGLAAAARLAHLGHEVELLEARDAPGGLASSVVHGGLAFDAGPYVLLDRPGLEWAFERLGTGLAERLSLVRLEEVYRVELEGGARVRIHSDAGRTADELEREWPGAGRRYADFVRRTARVHARLRPLQFVPRPRLSDLARSGAWRDVPFLLRSLEGVLARSGLPEPVRRALAIWTHVAAGDVRAAPSPLALVPALVHGVGAFVPEGGVGRVAAVLADRARELGVRLRTGCRVAGLVCEGGRAAGVRLAEGGEVRADAVVSNYSGLGTTLEWIEGLRAAAARRLARLPLQSPGVCAYLELRARGDAYLRFFLPASSGCRLFVQPAAIGHPARDGAYPARLIAPLRHAEAAALDEDAQERALERLLAEPWWRAGAGEVRVLATRVPRAFGRDFHLYRESMNPAMTARFMRRGRLAHRSPHLERLYLAGSSTHPGQWVSFCAVSGVHAADLCAADLRSAARRPC